MGHSGHSVWASAFVFCLITPRRFLLMEDFAVPIQKVSRWGLAVVPFLRQTVMRRPAVAVEAVVGQPHHPNEAVILKLTKPSPHVIATAKRSQFFARIATRQVNRVLK